MNPHTWLDLGLGELYVNNIRDGLIAVDPAHEADYRERAADYQQRIDALDAEVRALMGELPEHTAVITSPHPSPLSARRGFFGSRPFSRANAALQAMGAEPVDWSL